MTETEKLEEQEVNGKLFSSGQIVLAAFLGTPIAACVLIAQNYRVMRQIANARISVIVGALATMLVFILAFSLPENFPNFVLPAAYCVAIGQTVKYLQGDAMAAAEARGEKGSWLIPVAIGLACLAGISALLFLMIGTLS